MVVYGLDIDLHDFKYFEVGIFHILKFIIYLRASSQDFVETHQLNVILPYLKQIADSSLINITYLHTTCTVF